MKQFTHLVIDASSSITVIRKGNSIVVHVNTITMDRVTIELKHATIATLDDIATEPK